MDMGVERIVMVDSVSGERDLGPCDAAIVVQIYGDSIATSAVGSFSVGDIEELAIYAGVLAGCLVPHEVRAGVAELLVRAVLRGLSDSEAQARVCAASAMEEMAALARGADGGGGDVS